MIKKTFLYSIFLALIFTLTNIHAARNILYQGKYPDNIKTYTFGDNVNVREKPSLNAKTINQLPIATPVTVISTTSESSTINNYEEKWVEISYEIKGKKEKGYVWGGLLAKAFIKVPEGIVLAGINKADKETFKKKVEIRWVFGKKIISTIEFDAIEMPESPSLLYAIGGEYLGNKGFEKSMVFFKISFIYEACDYPNGDVLIATDLKNRKLYYVLEAISSSGEGHKVTTKLIFPKEPKGKPNQIILLSNHEYINDEGKEIKETKLETYEFDGEKFVKLN